MLYTAEEEKPEEAPCHLEQNDDYPRINRIRYLAEEKIYLRNNSPTSIINWFEKYPPLGGLGKIKLAEAYLEQGQNNKVSELVKDGWITAQIRKNDLGYYRAKFKKFINSDDHIKRADYLAWERKYWDLKRMLKYLPSDQRALYNARQILMSNSYGPYFVNSACCIKAHHTHTSILL